MPIRTSADVTPEEPKPTPPDPIRVPQREPGRDEPELPPKDPPKRIDDPPVPGEPLEIIAT